MSLGFTIREGFEYEKDGMQTKVGYTGSLEGDSGQWKRQDSVMMETERDDQFFLRFLGWMVIIWSLVGQFVMASQQWKQGVQWPDE